MQGTFYFILIFSGVLILFSMLRTKRFFAALLLSVLQGIVAFLRRILSAAFSAYISR